MLDVAGPPKPPSSVSVHVDVKMYRTILHLMLDLVVFWRLSKTREPVFWSQSHAISNHMQDTQSFLASDAIASLQLSKSEGSICTHWMGDKGIDC